jgi:iron complex transport system substrate-binding protein
MNYLKHLSLFIIVFLTILGCNSRSGQDNNLTSANYEVKYAKGFLVNKQAEYTEVSVRNPWDTSKLLQKYILVDKNIDLPNNLPQGTIIRTPLKNVIAYSAIHCSSLKEIGALEIIKGVAESQYISIDEIQEGIKNGTITDIGMAGAPDIEKIIMLDSEAIFATPIMGQTYGNISKTRIPIIEAVDYTEPNPLGQAEWIRFYSLFTNTQHIADSLFCITENNYNEIKEKVSTSIKERPTVLTEMKYMDSWNMPGGKSFMSTMLSDAGANYIWSDNDSETFLPLPFETVLDKGGDADFWLIKYYSPNDMTYESLKREYKPYSYFKAYKERNIYACNTMKSPYYIDLPIHPDRILKDFAYIFYPELFEKYTPQYYRVIN